MFQIKEFKSKVGSLEEQVNQFLKELEVNGHRFVDLKYVVRDSIKEQSVLVIYECVEESTPKEETELKTEKIERDEAWGYAIRDACVGVTWDWCEVGFSTQEEALKRGKEVYCSDKNCMANFSLFVGQERNYLPEVDVVQLLERIDDEVDGNCLAIQKDFLNVSDEAMDELSEEMNRVLQKWYVKHGQLGKAKELVKVEMVVG